MDLSHSQWIQPLVTVSVGSFIAFRAHKKFPQHFWCFRRFLCFVASHFYRIQKGQDKKQLIDPEFKIGGQRNWIQVLSNSGIASVLVVALWVLTEGKDYFLNSKDSPLITAIIGGVIGHYCCYNGDTWSLEIGVLSDDRPRLITTFKHVRKGTNGGVTKTGLLAAAGGGSVIGLSYFLLELLTIGCGFYRVLNLVDSAQFARRLLASQDQLLKRFQVCTEFEPKYDSPAMFINIVQ
ncbi:unnamed protein product [Vicia faba]|uniref:Protein PGR n=1 Tax=Vicia faba TaxID=3906 RepID=A0AAV0YX27_VICFA|nr:unnamed protein product [Vicia faba]